MSQLKQYEQFLEVAQQLGYQVRYDYFGGTGGGVCQYGGKKWLFIDLALTVQDQMDVVFSALGADPLFSTVELPAGVRQVLFDRRVA